MLKEKKFVLWFDEIDLGDVLLVGGKNASLGEMYRELRRKGIRVPNGFAVTTYAYKKTLEYSGVAAELRKLFKNVDIKNVEKLSEIGRKARDLILHCDFPTEIRKDIALAYSKLCKLYKAREVDVAVRSSATSEDLPTLSFAGQQETFLNIRGLHELFDAIKKCFASLFTNRAIAYREENKISHEKIAISVGVQKMVRSDLASAGVAFTLDTETGFRDVVFITASYGLGEAVVAGQVNPDEYYVFKPTLVQGYRPIIRKRLGDKFFKIIYSEEGTKQTTRRADVPSEERKKFCLSDEEILQLAKWCVAIEEHYSKKYKKPTPMDIEWAKDGIENKLYIVQARPETVQAVKPVDVYEEYYLKRKGKVIVEGLSVGAKIASGKAHIIKDIKFASKFKPGEVLVTEMTDPDWVPIMRMASAIVTDRGGRTCFAGETKVLTNKGFISMEELYEYFNLNKDEEELFILSLNSKTLKTEWKKIRSLAKNKLNAIRISISQTGRAFDNTIDVTPDHKFYTFDNAILIKKEIFDILNKNEFVAIADKINDFSIAPINYKLAYLLGALTTDGNIYLKKGKNKFRGGAITFTQKSTNEKALFISKVKDYFEEIFGKKFIEREKYTQYCANGRVIIGSATDYRCYGLIAALKLNLLIQKLPKLALEFDRFASLNFLAGVIDGDGTFYNGRIKIYVSKINLLEAVVLACLKLGIVPQITKNRSIYNVQIVEKIDEILNYTFRVKGVSKKRIFDSKLFSAKQILSNCIDKVDYKGKIKPHVEKNLLISKRKLEFILKNKNLRKEIKENLLKIISSNLRMYRVRKIKDLGEIDVYDVEVEANDELNHNFIVFSKRYTPLIVSNSHAAIVSRELGVACVVGTKAATKKIQTGQNVTVSCAEGDIGKVYFGLLPYGKRVVKLKEIPKTKTKIYMNVGNPEEAFELSFLPNDGVGLAREEFIVSNYIKIHPLALIHFETIKDEEIKKQIEEITFGYADKKQFYIDKLAEGIALIAAAFWPKSVILRLVDFKTNEYANLIGGTAFEPKEENPMIGWRGAARYYSKNYEQGFALECEAIKKVRNQFGLKNLKLMIPMCRTVEEGKKVLELLEKYGLKRGRDGLEVYAMAELPSNFLLAEEFCKLFDGFSIGSNDLTQMIFGIDRDNELVAYLYDERSEAVKKLIKELIETAKKFGKKVSICGDAPSTHPEFNKFLIECGINSISLSPDVVIKNRILISEFEKSLEKK